MSFECTGCELCCKEIGHIIGSIAPMEWMQKATDEFPYKANADGSCEKLIDNKCSVYDDRPLLCNIERMADEAEVEINKEVWYKMNYIGCKMLQDKDALKLELVA